MGSLIQSARRGLGVLATEVLCSQVNTRVPWGNVLRVGRPRRAVVIELSRLGDAVQASALAARVAREGLAEETVLAVDASWAALFTGVRGVDRVISVSGGGRSRRARAAIGIERSDCAINASPSVRNTLAVFASSARTKVGYLDLTSPLTPFSRRRHVLHIHHRPRLEGFGETRGPWVRRIVPKGVPLARRADPVLALLGITGELAPPRLVPTAAASEWAQAWLEREGGAPDRWIVFHPGASWVFREWPRDRWAALGRSLARRLGARIVVIGSRAEAEIVHSIAAGIGAAAAVAIDEPLPQMAALISRARVFVGGDSGPLHLAAALGVPAVGLFGPAGPELTAPASLVGDAIHHRYPCSPCDQRRCLRPTDPCIHAIDSSEVERAVSALWQAREIVASPLQSFDTPGSK